jgi:hypothetical protein
MSYELRIRDFRRLRIGFYKNKLCEDSGNKTRWKKSKFAGKVIFLCLQFPCFSD